MHQCREHKLSTTKHPLADRYNPPLVTTPLSKSLIAEPPFGGNTPAKNREPNLSRARLHRSPIKRSRGGAASRTRGGRGGEKVAPVFSLLCKAGHFLPPLVDPGLPRGVKGGWKSGSGGCRITWACTHLHHAIVGHLARFLKRVG